MLLSIDPVVQLSASNDVVQILQEAAPASDGGAIVELTVNGITTQYGDSTSGIGSLTLVGNGGADSFTFLSTLAVAVSIDGGTGNDTITGTRPGHRLDHRRPQ